MAVTFGNVENTDYAWAQTSGLASSVAVTKPSCNVGDTLVALGYSNHASIGLRVATANGFTNLYTQTNATYGNYICAWRVADGTEGSTITVEQNGSGTTNITACVLVLPGARKLKPLNSPNSNNNAVDGVTVATGTPTSAPMYNGGISFTFSGAVSSTAYATGDEPTGYTLVKQAVNNSATWFGLAYQAKPAADAAGPLTWDRTAGPKCAASFYVEPELEFPLIGNRQDYAGGGVAITSATPHRLYSDNLLTYKAVSGDEVRELAVRIGTSVGDGSGVEIGVYDVTSGYASASKVVSATIGTLTANAWNRVAVTPTALTAGNTYAIALRCISATNVSVLSNYNGNQSVRDSTQTGGTALQSTWSDDGTPTDNRHQLYARVFNSSQAQVTSGTPQFTTTSAGTSHSASITIPACTKLGVILALEYNYTVSNVQFNGSAMTSVASQTYTPTSPSVQLCVYYIDTTYSAGSYNLTFDTSSSAEVGVFVMPMTGAASGAPEDYYFDTQDNAGDIVGDAGTFDTSPGAQTMSLCINSSTSPVATVNTPFSRMLSTTNATSRIAGGEDWFPTSGTRSAIYDFDATTGNKLMVAVSFASATAGAPLSITSVTPSQIDSGESVVIAGTGFGASQGSSFVKIGDTTQTVTAWSDTSITITADRASQSMGAATLTVVKV